MEFNLIDFIEHALNLLILFLLLRHFLYKPVSKFMAEREANFAREREQLDASRNEANVLKAQYETSMKNARLDAEHIAEERRKVCRTRSGRPPQKGQAGRAGHPLRRDAPGARRTRGHDERAQNADSRACRRHRGERSSNARSPRRITSASSTAFSTRSAKVISGLHTQRIFLCLQADLLSRCAFAARTRAGMNTRTYFELFV